MSALSPRQMFVLDLACKPIVEALGVPYLVGSAAERQPYRDVDVRLMLPDATYDTLDAAVGADAITFISLAVATYLQSFTGLPVDFQIQRTTEANALHKGMRNGLGFCHLASFEGDARPDRSGEHTKEEA